MGSRIPTWASFVAAPVVVLLTIFSYYAYTRHHPTVSGNAAGSPVDSAVLQQSSDPKALLGIADHFYWLNNGPAAAPFFARAEKLFAAEGDSRNELYAKVGRLRSQAETMSFGDLSRILNEQLQTPLVRSDSRLRLWILIAKGYTDIELDYRVSKRDWLAATTGKFLPSESRTILKSTLLRTNVLRIRAFPSANAALLGTERREFVRR